MAPQFSKVDLNKLWHDVQNEETFICAKFGKDLFNISKVIGRKKMAKFFFDSQCITVNSVKKSIKHLKYNSIVHEQNLKACNRASERSLLTGM